MWGWGPGWLGGAPTSRIPRIPAPPGRARARPRAPGASPAPRPPPGGPSGLGAPREGAHRMARFASRLRPRGGPPARLGAGGGLSWRRHPETSRRESGAPPRTLPPADELQQPVRSFPGARVVHQVVHQVVHLVVHLVGSGCTNSAGRALDSRSAEVSPCVTLSFGEGPSPPGCHWRWPNWAACQRGLPLACVTSHHAGRHAHPA